MALSVLAHAAIAASIAIGEAPEAPAAGAAIDIEIVSSADREAARLAPRAGEAPAAPPLSRPMTAPGGGAASLDLATASAARPDLAVPISRPSEWRGRPPEAPAAAEVLALAPPGGLVRAPAQPSRAGEAPAKRPPRTDLAERRTGETTSATTERGPATQPPRPAQGVSLNAPPEYPEEARLQGWHGRVVLAVTVAPDGAVTDLRVQSSSGHALLDEAAMRAVRRWRFEPGRRGGVPVTAAAVVPVRFRLTD